jgi:hypothetical protein
MSKIAENGLSVIALEESLLSRNALEATITILITRVAISLRELTAHTSEKDTMTMSRFLMARIATTRSTDTRENKWAN